MNALSIILLQLNSANKKFLNARTISVELSVSTKLANKGNYLRNMHIKLRRRKVSSNVKNTSFKCVNMKLKYYKLTKRAEGAGVKM